MRLFLFELSDYFSDTFFFSKNFCEFFIRFFVCEILENILVFFFIKSQKIQTLFLMLHQLNRINLSNFFLPLWVQCKKYLKFSNFCLYVFWFKRNSHLWPNNLKSISALLNLMISKICIFEKKRNSVSCWFKMTKIFF